MPRCEYCERTDYPVSNYNPDKKFECPSCRMKRLKIEESESKDSLINKLVIVQRELHSMHQTVKYTSAMLDVEQRKLKEAQKLLKRWLTYGELTNCQSIPLLDETKKIIFL